MKNSTHIESEVLFQKMGNSWYVFAEIGGEVFFSPLPDGMDPKTDRVEIMHFVESKTRHTASPMAEAA